jgi:glutamine synthetase
MAKDLAKWAKEKGVKYFMISYTDLFGGQRAKLVPTQAINDMAEWTGRALPAFATWLDLTPAHPDLMAVPDPSSASSCRGRKTWPGSPPAPRWKASLSIRPRATCWKS